MGASRKISKRVIALLLGAILLLAVMPFALRIIATADDDNDGPLLDKELVVDEEVLDDKPEVTDPATDPEVDPVDPVNPTDPDVVVPDEEDEGDGVKANLPNKDGTKSTAVQDKVIKNEGQEEIKPLLGPQETVSTQAELEAALADEDVIEITVDTNMTLGASFDGDVNGSKTITGSGSITLTRDPGSAGALFTVLAGSELSISNLTIEGINDSTPGRGPLADVEPGATLSILGGATLSNNANTDPAQPWGGAIHNAGTLVMSGGSITGNKVIALTSVYGGGVYNAAGAVFTLSGGTIGGNRIEGAQAYGGGVYVSPGSTFSMTGGTISANSVTGSTAQGGGLYLGNTPTDAIGLGAILSNTSSGQGAGVYVDANSIFSGTRIADNQVTLGNDPIESGKGGGIYVADGVKTILRGSTVVDDNEAIGGGGVFVAAEGSLELMRFDGIDPTISNNVAKGNSVRGRSGDGGGILALGTLTASGAAFNGNNATDNGGGLSARNTVNLSYVKFTNNKAFYGGGMRVSSLATIVCDNTSFIGNTAQIGGGVMNHGSLALRGSTIFDNNVSQQLNGEGSSITNLWLSDAAAPTLAVEGSLSIDTPILLATDPSSGSNGMPVMLTGALTGDPLVIGGFGRVHGSDQSSNDPDGGVITADTRYQVTIDLAVGNVIVRGQGYQITTNDWGLVRLAQTYSAYSTQLTEHNEIIVTGTGPGPTPTPTPEPDPTPPGPKAGTGDYMLEAADVAVGFSLVGLISAIAAAVHIRRRLMKRRL